MRRWSNPESEVQEQSFVVKRYESGETGFIAPFVLEVESRLPR